ncbi:unnamed protein product [Brassicogethes aeneus]|uniref:Myb/SANT-like DNA-binding domain-containing protein n=1 Tax=Brassicogethes aeneus TaxID=1431903 RepID=A0A9P0FG26_BRAAE|nr:unnamed protein product [Brassicogethes aeneus]
MKKVIRQSYPNYIVTFEPESNNKENVYHKPDCKVQKEKQWGRNATLRLIELRKQYDDDFKSTTKRNDEVWGQIASDMQEEFNVSLTQCKDKWQYLRKCYIKKKENMGASATGSSPAKFEYFEEMDDFLGQKHSVTPKFVASSSKGNQAHGSDDTSALNDSDSDVSASKRKKRKIETPKEDILVDLVKSYKENVKKRDKTAR